MGLVSRLRIWSRALVRRRAVETELADEFRFHLEMEAERLTRAGLPRAEAERRARLAFGGVEGHKQTMRAGLGVLQLERARNDLRVAVRRLRREPGFTAAAVLTLAIGIGGNAAVFSLVNGVLLRPLPYPDADRIVTIAHRSRGGDVPERLPNASATHVVYEESRSFEAMALYMPEEANLTGDGVAPVRLAVVDATRSLFDVLRVPPALGRTFTAEEDAPGGPRAAILSHALWRQQFGGDSGIVGRTIVLDGVARTVVGVMPARFAFPTRDTQLWRPMRVDRADLSGFNTPGIGRLKPGVTPEAAERELTALLPRVVEVVDFLPAAVLASSGLRPDVHPYEEDVVGDTDTALWVLWAMIALVLLIACVNVAGLLLVRAEARRREVAMRIALGAGRGHLVAQSLAESAVLLALGTACGLALAWAALRALPGVAADVLPRLDEVRLDAAALAVTALVAGAAAVAFGVLPALRQSGTMPSAVLQGGVRATDGRGTVRLRHLLVVAQVAMAAVLLVGSGLMLRSVAKLRAVDPGFAPSGVVTFRVALPVARYRESREVARLHDGLLARIRLLPGVRAAGATGRLPLTGRDILFDPLRVKGMPLPPDQLPPLAEMRIATPGYFEAMGIPLLEGRPPERGDWERQTGAVLVSERIARQVIRGRRAPGAQVAHGLAGVPGESPWSEVVGVVGDVHSVSLQEPPMGAVYYAMVNRDGVDKDWMAWSMVYAVRADGSLSALLPAIRRIVHEADAELPIAEVRTLDDVVEAARAEMRFTMLGLSAAALVGVFLGAVGLYGVLSYLTALRTREIGVRLALGASPRSVRRMVLRHGVLVTVTGLALGLVAALALRRLATPLLFGVAPADPPTLLAAAVLLLLIGVVATWLPARRAARLDPVRALRSE